MEPGSRWVLVLAGGDGKRLNDLTREIVGRAIPKQYCRIYGDRSLLESTLSRTKRFTPASRSLVILNQAHFAFGMRELSSLPAANVLVQPCNRDTGPGIVFSLLHLAKRDPEALVAVFPSDHFVDDDAHFMTYVATASRVVADYPDKIALLGICPERPDVELGYITAGESLPHSEGAWRVGSFAEKPDRERAFHLIRDGALWNSFVMVFRVSRMLELLGAVVPAELDRVRRLLVSQAALSAGYADLDAWNFSTRFLSRIPAELVAIRVDGVHWSDWGTRASVERTLVKLNQSPPWLDRRQTPDATREPRGVRDM